MCKVIKVCFLVGIISLILVNCKKDDKNPVLPVISTNNLTAINESSVICGGEVLSSGSSDIVEKGVCWSISSNPSVENNKTSEGAGIGSFTSTLSGLNSNTTYYVRAYATNGQVTSYGEVKSFKTSGSSIQIDKNIQYQIIRGFGGATVFTPGSTSNPGSLPTPEQLDILYGNGTGQIGLSILRIRVASDDDPNWRATELAHALKVKSHGAIVIASPWSPPLRMKSNSNLVGGFLKPASYEEYANYLNNFAKYMSDNGAELYAISVQNEPDITVSYESCSWTATEMKDFLKNYGHLITNTRVIAPESFQFIQNFSDEILYDVTAAANIDIVGGHIYGGGLTDYSFARSKGKELWMTEHYTTSTDDANLWSAAIGVATEIHNCMTIGQYSAYIWWYLKRFYGPMGENGSITKRGWIMANYSKFIRPGFYRVSTSDASLQDTYVSAYYGNKLVIIAINTGSSEVLQSFTINNLSASSVTPYTTSANLDLSPGASVGVSNNKFAYILPASSITTFVQDL